MTEVKTVQSLYFSPTGTTKKIVSTIAANTGLRLIPPVELTLHHQRDSFNGKIQGDLLIVGAPVYHGSPPLLMLEPLNRLEGEGKWAVPVAVYGNRSPETCVEELTKILRSKGFKVPAAASFSAEHSVSSPSIFLIAPGRPDQSDLEIAAKFGAQIYEKGSYGLSEIQMSNLLYNYFTKEMVDSLPEGYHKKAVDRARDLVGVEFSKNAMCTNCLSCENVCPTDAIKIELEEINDELCIRCMACTRACPEGVLNIRLRSAATPEYLLRMREIFSTRKEPKIFI